MQVTDRKVKIDRVESIDTQESQTYTRLHKVNLAYRQTDRQTEKHSYICDRHNNQKVL